MAIRAYKAKVKLPGGTSQVVSIDADTQSAAKKLAEMQYGKANIISVQ